LKTRTRSGIDQTVTGSFSEITVVPPFRQAAKHVFPFPDIPVFPRLEKFQDEPPTENKNNANDHNREIKKARHDFRILDRHVVLLVERRIWLKRGTAGRPGPHLISAG
jgi:hypothetical protein